MHSLRSGAWTHVELPIDADTAARASCRDGRSSLGNEVLGLLDPVVVQALVSWPRAIRRMRAVNARVATSQGLEYGVVVH